MTQEQTPAALVVAEELTEWARDYAPTELANALAVCASAMLRSQNAALREWFGKTDWLRPTLKPAELGKHLADVLRERIEALDGGPAGSGGWQHHAERMERDRNHWRDRAQAMYEHQRGECWHWQGVGDHIESMANSLPVVIRADALRALLAQAQEDVQDAVRALIATHAEMLEDNAYAYFELAYTRQTGWMAWITDKPLYGAPVVNPDRKVLAQGQGDTPDEACADAARAAQGGAA